MLFRSTLSGEHVVFIGKLNNLCEFLASFFFLAKLCEKFAEDAAILCCTNIVVFTALFVDCEVQLLNSLVIAAEVDVGSIPVLADNWFYPK